MPRKPKPSGRRGGRGYRSRSVNFREPLQRFLIVCEGERTEPAYFDGFRVPSVKIDVIGLGKDPLKLVERAIEKRGQGEYDQVWCVFDRDDVPAGHFNQALERARQRGIMIAYSNQAFELWYLLHFQYCAAAMSRRDYRDKLSLVLGRAYRKNDDNIYQALLPLQDTAIRNAERLLAHYDPANPAADDPSTTVHQLVQEINRFVQDARF